MKRLAVPLLALAGAAQACNPALPGPAPVTRIESARYTLAYRTVPDNVAAGAHFAVEFAVCSDRGAAPPKTIKVDAQMPEHRHGMNYQPRVVVLPGGRYRAEGLMFHMPGRWELSFEWRADGKTERLMHAIVLD